MMDICPSISVHLFNDGHCKGDMEFLRPGFLLVSVMFAVFQDLKLCCPKAVHRNVATFSLYHRSQSDTNTSANCDETLSSCWKCSVFLYTLFHLRSWSVIAFHLVCREINKDTSSVMHSQTAQQGQHRGPVHLAAAAVPLLPCQRGET